MKAVDTAAEAWGAELPDWVRVMAEAIDTSSQRAVAVTLRYSPTVVSQALNNKYTGSYAAIERAVQGAYLQHTVTCPVLGELPAQDCLEHQRQPYAATNPTRVRLYRACRGACPHSLITPLIAGKAGEEIVS